MTMTYNHGSHIVVSSFFQRGIQIDLSPQEQEKADAARKAKGPKTGDLVSGRIPSNLIRNFNKLCIAERTL
jgi:hypothetical protein